MRDGKFYTYKNNILSIIARIITIYRIGASIVVQTRVSQLPVYYSQLIYNPDCFLLHQDSKVPFSSVDNVSTLTIA